MQGIVKFFDEAKGFGFIVPDNGSKDVFLQRNACVIVQKGEIRTPPQQNGRAGGEAETDDSTKILRPRLRLSEVGAGPIERSHAADDFAVPRKELFALRKRRIVTVRHGVPSIGPTSVLARISHWLLAKGRPSWHNCVSTQQLEPKRERPSL